MRDGEAVVRVPGRYVSPGVALARAVTDRPIGDEVAAGAQDARELADEAFDAGVVVVDEDRAGDDDCCFFVDDVVDEFGEVGAVGADVSDLDAGARGAFGEAVEHGL